MEDNNLLMLACLLFQGKANPNAMSYNGSTPLHIAAGLKLHPIIATLVAIGADASVTNLEGDTAFNMSGANCKDLPEGFQTAGEMFDSSDEDKEMM